MIGGLKGDFLWFQTPDVGDGLKDALVVTGKLPWLLEPGDCHIHTGTDCFLCHWFLSFLARPLTIRI